MTKYSHPRHVEPSRELAGRVRSVQPLQLIEYERNISGPRSEHFVHTTGLLGLLLVLTEFRVILRCPSHHPAVRENDGEGAVRRVEAHHDVTVTGQILSERRVVPHFERSPRPHNHHGVRSLLR